MDWTLYKMIRDNENNIIPQMLIPGTGFRPLTGEAVDVGRYGYDSVVWGKTSGGVFVPVQVDTEGKQAVTASELEAKVDALNAKLDGVIDGTTPATTKSTGSSMEIYKATVDERPAANSVPVGACFMAVNTGEIWQSNGTTWVVM